MLWCVAKYVAIIHKENVNSITGFFFFFYFRRLLGVEDEEAQHIKYFKPVLCLIKSLELCANSSAVVALSFPSSKYVKLLQYSCE